MSLHIFPHNHHNNYHIEYTNHYIDINFLEYSLHNHILHMILLSKLYFLSNQNHHSLYIHHHHYLYHHHKLHYQIHCNHNQNHRSLYIHRHHYLYHHHKLRHLCYFLHKLLHQRGDENRGSTKSSDLKQSIHKILY